MADMLFGSEGDLSEPSADEGSAEEHGASVQRQEVVKRLRFDLSPERASPAKRRRIMTPGAKPKASKMNPNIRQPQRSHSTRKDEGSSAQNMDITSDDESEDEDVIMTGNSENSPGSEEPAGPSPKRVVGKGKAPAATTSSPRMRPAILHLGKHVPASYEALGDPLEDDELFELDWFAPSTRKPSEKGKGKSAEAASDVVPTASTALPPRHWHSFSAPQMSLNPELDDSGEVELSERAFRFPFNAQVIKRLSSLDSFLTPL